MKTTTTRGRGAVVLVAGLALLGGAASVATTPASAEPGSCDTPFPMGEFPSLVDQAVTTSTVVRGTTPTSFTGTVLGKIDGGIAPGVDMIMVDFSSAAGDSAIDRNGIWSGMSGSPVYTADGELLGAVAYGLAWGPSPIAGVTPYENMAEYQPAAPAPRVQVGRPEARAIAADSEVTRSQAQQGFQQLPMSLSISGLDRTRLRKLRKQGPDHLDTRGMRASGTASTAPSAAAGPEHLVAGGNLGAAISYGDITAGGVGTVTSVCDDWLIGFGHPMTYGGRTSLGMMPADAIYVQKDLIASFKVANMGAPAGTISQDRLTGISGTVGALPAETRIQSTVAYGSRGRTGSSASLDKRYTPFVTFAQILANHDVVIDAFQGGSETATFSVAGTGPGGDFVIDFADRYTSEWDISFESIWDIADVMWVLSGMDDVTVNGLEATAEVDDETATFRVRKVEQRLRGAWRPVNRRRPALAVPGRTMRLRVTVANEKTTALVPLGVAVPERARRGGFLEVVGGASQWNQDVYDAETPADLADALAAGARNDQVAATLHVGRGESQPSRARSEPQDLVVRGRKLVDVFVLR